MGVSHTDAGESKALKRVFTSDSERDDTYRRYSSALARYIRRDEKSSREKCGQVTLKSQKHPRKYLFYKKRILVRAPR